MSSPYLSFSWFYSLLPPRKFISPSAGDSKQSSVTEITLSRYSGKSPTRQTGGRWKPSAYLLAASIALLISAFLSLGRPESAHDYLKVEPLLKRGWLWADRSLNCPGIKSGAFYELENESTTSEIFVSDEGRILASRLPFPEEPFTCNEVSNPQFIEEIP